MSKYLGINVKDEDGDTWEIWPDRGVCRTSYRVFQTDGTWFYVRASETSVPILNAPRFARFIVTEIERRWPPRALAESAPDETALVQSDEVLVNALKMAERRTKLATRVAIAGWAVGVIQSLLYLFG